MYTWALFFITASFIYIYEIIKNPSYKNWGILTFLTICVSYTQYFSLLSSVILYIVFLAYILRKNRKLIKNWFSSVVICIIAYLPWIPIAYSQFTAGHEGYWIKEVTLFTVINDIYQIFSPLSSDMFMTKGMSISTIADTILSSNIYI